jgi:hypothetical protein
MVPLLRVMDKAMVPSIEQLTPLLSDIQKSNQYFQKTLQMDEPGYQKKLTEMKIWFNMNYPTLNATGMLDLTTLNGKMHVTQDNID